MGGESSTTEQKSSTTQPWAEAQPFLKSLLGQLGGQVGNAALTGTESAALDRLSQTAAQGNPYAPQIGGVVNDLLKGGGATAQKSAIDQNYLDYVKRLQPVADGANVGPNGNPALASWLDTIKSDVGNSVNGQFAAAGRDLSGANLQAYGRGVMQAIAPVVASQYNTDEASRRSAAADIYNAGVSNAGLINGMQQQALTNQVQGITQSNNALGADNYGATQQLAIEAQKRGIPLSALGLLTQMGVSLAGLGSQSTNTSTGTKEMSGAEQFGTIAKGINDLVNPFTSLMRPGTK